MKIGGLQIISLNDYPGEIASVIFTQGCNFRCGYCHNKQLIPTFSENLKDEDEILEYLEEKKDKITAVVISGGEPTIQKDLIQFLIKLRELDLKIKLDTNGSNPLVIKEILNSSLIDFIAMDIKTIPEKYSTIIGSTINVNNIYHSISLIEASGILYQFRTTILKHIHSMTDILGIQKVINSNLLLQNFEPQTDNFFDQKLTSENRFTEKEFNELLKL